MREIAEDVDEGEVALECALGLVDDEDGVDAALVHLGDDRAQ